MAANNGLKELEREERQLQRTNDRSSCARLGRDEGSSVAISTGDKREDKAGNFSASGSKLNTMFEFGGHFNINSLDKVWYGMVYWEGPWRILL